MVKLHREAGAPRGHASSGEWQHAQDAICDIAARHRGMWRAPGPSTTGRSRGGAAPPPPPPPPPPPRAGGASTGGTGAAPEISSATFDPSLGVDLAAMRQ